MRIFSFVTVCTFILLLVGCTSSTKEMKVVEITPNTDLLAQFAFEDKVYFIEGNKTPAEKINKEIGMIEKSVVDLKENGDYIIANAQIDPLDNARIFSIKDVPKDTVVAVQVHDIYYTAIIGRKLE